MNTWYTWNTTLGDVTTVKLKRETKKALADLGKKDDTYDTIVQQLIEFYLTNKDKVKPQKR